MRSEWNAVSLKSGAWNCKVETGVAGSCPHDIKDPFRLLTTVTYKLTTNLACYLTTVRWFQKLQNDAASPRHSTVPATIIRIPHIGAICRRLQKVAGPRNDGWRLPIVGGRRPTMNARNIMPTAYSFAARQNGISFPRYQQSAFNQPTSTTNNGNVVSTSRCWNHKPCNWQLLSATCVIFGTYIS